MGEVGAHVAPPDLTPLQEALLGWGEGHRRDLPWRRTRDPWAVLVSELMLQQTQVARVVPKYGAFLARFPTVAACASASVGDVVRAWAGLGYNRRAVNLHRLATVVVAEHAGQLPTELTALRALPGVGPYTARAVLAFAHERDVGVLDTNARRVLSRAFAERAVGAAGAQRLADDVVPSGRGWAWNSTVLDLGATVCRARAPRCPACPLGSLCAWARAGGPDPAARSQAAQQSFAGSDRQGRGRLVDALRHGPVPLAELAVVAGWPDDHARARRTAEALVADGLARLESSTLVLS